MKPKEKAEELVKKYTDMSIFKFAAKKCALIAVDEILKNYYKNHFQTGKKIDYWIEVKEEIENLQS
jgi:hypothetical protein